VDVGESLLHESLLGNDKIVAMENVNARYLEKKDFQDELDGVVMDVSFISLRLMFPMLARILKENGDAFVLIKPQFECEKKNIGKSGIVKTEAHPKIVEKVLDYAIENGLFPFNIVNAPIRKGKNVEYVLHLKPTNYYAKSKKSIMESVQYFVRHNNSI
jgi:23S rRNA (cytidine1920-2'-O)/16S rRNA (cytidine1409-2'-O)-methyltransferase